MGSPLCGAAESIDLYPVSQFPASATDPCVMLRHFEGLGRFREVLKRVVMLGIIDRMVKAVANE